MHAGVWHIQVWGQLTKAVSKQPYNQWWTALPSLLRHAAQIPRFNRAPLDIEKLWNLVRSNGGWGVAELAAECCAPPEYPLAMSRCAAAMCCIDHEALVCSEICIQL